MAASTENDEQSLCARCISNAQFAKWIEENGSHGKCDFDKSHGRSNAVVTVEAFAEEVDRYFRDNYQRGEEYMCGRPDSDNASYDTYGEPYQDILGNDLECDEDVFNAVVASLPDAAIVTSRKATSPSMMIASTMNRQLTQRRDRGSMKKNIGMKIGSRCSGASFAGPFSSGDVSSRQKNLSIACLESRKSITTALSGPFTS